MGALNPKTPLQTQDETNDSFDERLVVVINKWVL
jgi:hypothetical protein